MTRSEANMVIINLLEVYLKQNPDIRFGQALWNLGIATHRQVIDTDFNYGSLDIFYEESDVTLENIQYEQKRRNSIRSN